MKGGILILGLVIGIILIIISNKTKASKYIKIAGILIIIACLFAVIPDFITGFKQGYAGTANFK